MRYINLRFTYLLTYLLNKPSVTSMSDYIAVSQLARQAIIIIKITIIIIVIKCEATEALIAFD